MTKTKTQKQRSRNQRAKPTKARKSAGMKKQREFNFLNGNSLSLNMRRPNGKPIRSTVSAPVARSFKGGVTRAMITQLGSGVTRIKHSEYVTDVLGAMDFSGDSTQINPGNQDLFPWLSSIASRYESYTFRELGFRYETTSPTSTPGSVILTADYNPTAALPAAKVQALAMESAIRSPPWEPIVHKSLSHNLTKRKSYYIRDDSDVPDPDLYDTGVFMAMVEGVPTESGSIGELHVDYVVDLMTPTLSNSNTFGESVDIVAESLTIDSTDNYRYLFEVPISYNPDDNNFEVGPHINVAGDNGTNTGNIGAIKFKSPGTYLVTMEFGVPGNDVQERAPLVLPATGNLWTSGIADPNPGTSVPSTYIIVIPRNGDSIMVDAVHNRATGSYIVQTTQPNAVFGVGSTASPASGTIGHTSVQIYVAPYNINNVISTGSLSRIGSTVLPALRKERSVVAQRLLESRTARLVKKETYHHDELLAMILDLKLRIEDGSLSSKQIQKKDLEIQEKKGMCVVTAPGGARTGHVTPPTFR